MARRKWTENDDIVTLYLYRFNNVGLPFTLDQVATKLQIPIDSLKMRIRNVKFIDKKIGLPNVAKQTVTIYHRFNGMPETELRSLVLKILNNCDTKTKR